MSTELQTTRVDLSGLLEVMGRNLYSSPSVAVRELVQNAHDACVRRQIEDSGNSHEARISIQTDLSRRRLIIEDTGAGLTKNEIIDHLATIGSGYTRIVRNNTQTDEMIGYFGLGFLSAYIVSDKVEMITSSYQEPGRAWHFVSKNGQRFTIDETEHDTVGARVILYLSEEYQELSDANYLSSLLMKYCRLLAIPIYLNGNDKPINHEPPPWRLDAQQVSPLRLRKMRHEFAESLDNEFESLCEIPILPTEDCNVAGLIWIHDGSYYSNADNRNVFVFIRGMYITSEARELMPGWSGFCSCVLESSSLIPTASREDLQKNDFYYQVQEHIYRSLVDGLIHVARNDSETWQRIVARHNESLLGAAVSDDELFAAIHDYLHVPTSEGEYTLAELTSHGQKQLLVTMEERGGYEEILSRAQKIPVIYGYRYAVLGFCREYAEHRRLTVNLLGTREASDNLFNRVDVDEEQQALFDRLFAREREKLIIVEYEPDYIPMLLVPDEEALLKQRVESDEANRRISTSALSMARMFTDKLQAETVAYLYLNRSSPVIKQILGLDAHRQEQAARLVRSFMIVVGHNEKLETVNSVAEELEKYMHTLMEMIGGE